MDLPVVGWMGLALTSIFEVCRPGYSVPGLSERGDCGSSLMSCDCDLEARRRLGGERERLGCSEVVRPVEVGRLGCLEGGWLDQLMGVCWTGGMYAFVSGLGSSFASTMKLISSCSPVSSRRTLDAACSHRCHLHPLPRPLLLHLARF